MIVIPFLYTIEKEDADTELSRKLLQEKDDIISICLRALSNVVNNHYIFSPCEAADKIKERWRYQECDSIESIPLFVEEYLEVTGEPTDMVYSPDSYTRFIVISVRSPIFLPCATTRSSAGFAPISMDALPKGGMKQGKIQWLLLQVSG